MKLFLTYIIAASMVISCDHDKKIDEMKDISKKLMQLFIRKDTTQISALFTDKDNLQNKSDEIAEDSDLFGLITKKYGIPAKREFIFSKGINEENVIEINILNQTDSTLNIKSCKLIVFFYPDQFYSKNHNFLDYTLISVPVFEEKKKIIIAPPLKLQ